jgi:hypothetical protein
MAKVAFKESIRKLEQVRHISSPILKVVFIQRVVNELMGADSELNQALEADTVLYLIFYAMVTLKSNENQTLGARFLEEVYYIKHFIHENQVDFI